MYSHKMIQKFMRKHLPSQCDQFRDNSQQENKETQPTKTNKLKLSHRPEKNKKKSSNSRKHFKKERKPVVIQINSQDEYIPDVSARNNQCDSVKKFAELDEQEIQYYKQKLNIKQKIQKQQKIVEPQPKKFEPPKDVVKVPKFIYQYPPYPLGPTDVWPPKYPNSWRSFKEQMRDTRRLD